MEQHQKLFCFNYDSTDSLSIAQMIKIHEENERKFWVAREIKHFIQFNIFRRSKNMKEGNVAECSSCGYEIESEDIREFEGDFYCLGCFEDSFSYCYECGEVIENNYACWSEIDERLYCEDCYSDKFTKCAACGCELDVNDCISNGYYDDYCTDCFYENYFFCDGCDAAINIEDICYDENSEADYCYSCYEQHCGSVYIHNYEYKPDPDFKIAQGKEKRRNKTLYFGLELEVENTDKSISNDDMAENVIEYIDAYCKEDGSLDSGFEIVTHPFSWEWYIDKKENFNTLLTGLSENGFTSFAEGTCGIHIHLSKNAFEGTVHLFKFLKLFYDNENFSFIKSISQRTANSSRGGCQWGSGPESVDTSEQIDIAKKKDSPNRYTAVNLENRETVEVRIFRGTLNRGSFHKNIEFVKALFDFTLNIGISQCTWKSFSSYVKENFLTYGNLFKFMEKKNLFV